jgi:hypothetical protein
MRFLLVLPRDGKGTAAPSLSDRSPGGKREARRDTGHRIGKDEIDSHNLVSYQFAWPFRPWLSEGESMLNRIFVGLLLCLALLVGSQAGLAQDKARQSNDPIAQLLRDGWKIVQDGVLQRERGAHQVETYVFGAPGFVWKLQDLQRQLHDLRVAYQADPTPELRKTILSHRQEIANTQKLIALAQAAELDGEVPPPPGKTSCSINFGYSATAAALTSVQGVTATANANFSGTCGFTGEVYAYSYSTAVVSGGSTTSTLTDGPRSGASVTASSYTSQTGGPTCTSYAYASMTSSSLSPSSYTVSATNGSCPAPATPPTVTVTSDSGTPIYLYGTDCVTITWTTHISGGTSPYSTTMYVNGYSVGSGTSYSSTFCNYETNYTQTVAVSASVTDSASQTGSGSQTTTIYNHFYRDPGNGGCLSEFPTQPCE